MNYFQYLISLQEVIMDQQAFTFLLTTDNHLGFRDDDHIRRKDSYMAFEEALRKARERDVDFILLGGDLFHTNRPSTNIEHKCIKIIKQHMNASVDKSTSFKRTQGNFSHFRKLNHANFEDANLKVPYPIMTIHGNHDDPTGPNAQSICEKLATCGLLNYFGATNNLDVDDKRILIEPIVLEKNKIKLALYGLGFIPDYKLKMALEKNEVSFSEPPGDTFNILVVHQNRIPFNKNKYIPDDLFPTFFHLIVRGHEHATQSPEKIPESKVNGMVYQPGSTVATSISTIEAPSKKVGLISVSFNSEATGEKSLSSMYKMDYELIDLKCCRQMIFEDISHKKIVNHIKNSTGSLKVTSFEFRKLSQEYVEERVKSLLKTKRSLIETALAAYDGPEKLDRFRLPLIRIRVEFKTKAEKFDELAISSQFYPSYVANKNIVLYKKQQLSRTEEGNMENITFLNEDVDEDTLDDFDYMDLNDMRVDIDLVIENYFKERPDTILQALSLEEYTNAIRGSALEGNVISKVLSKKKQIILSEYKRAIKDEEKARLMSASESVVHDWFIQAFRSKAVRSSKEGGDEVIEIDI